jgi:hypothetical protein
MNSLVTISTGAGVDSCRRWIATFFVFGLMKSRMPESFGKASDAWMFLINAWSCRSFLFSQSAYEPLIVMKTVFDVSTMYFLHTPQDSAHSVRVFADMPSCSQ